MAQRLAQPFDVFGSEPENESSRTHEAHLRHVEFVQEMEPEMVASLLVEAADIYAEVSKMIFYETNLHLRGEKNRILTFDHLYVSVQDTLNIDLEQFPDPESELSGMALRVASCIDRCLTTIRSQCSKIASFETKKNALETLRKICMSLCWAHGFVLEDFRRHRQTERLLVAAMMDIVVSLGQSEFNSMKPWCNVELKKLQKLGREHGLFEPLEGIIHYFRLSTTIDGIGEGTRRAENDGTENNHSMGQVKEEMSGI